MKRCRKKDLVESCRTTEEYEAAIHKLLEELRL